MDNNILNINFKKKRVGFVTSPIFIKTGFSNNARSLFPYLYKTGKYELFHLNQSIPENDANFLRYPWHNNGVFKPGTFDENRIRADGNYQRFVSYGNAAVESFIIDNKLDILIHVEDGWSSDENAYLKSKWFPFIKNNFLQWTTIDSMPILPLYRNFAAECPNMWVWASFAEKALKEIDAKKFNHVKTVYGCLNTDEYFPISKKEKNELRKQFNIDLDTKIFIQLGRNQLRKLFPCSLEAFAKFKKDNPNYKSKLLFHCSWNEPAGWPLQRLLSDFGLKADDVLTTYFCRNCNKWEIKPFDGEEKDCRYCNAQKSQITAGVTSTITNQELSYIYGIADASLSIFTSGGMEYTNVQSLLCGLPLLCSDYSSGEDFTQWPFVFKLDGSYTYEQGTGFKKHVPNQNTIVNFFKTICEMSEDQKQSISNDGRAWALKTFCVNNIGKKVEEFIDSCDSHGWNFEYPAELKNPNYPLKEIKDDIEWLRDMYENILQMHEEKDANCPGIRNWLTQMQRGMSRKDIHVFFCNVAKEDNAKIELQEKQKLEKEKIKTNGKKKFLIVMKESIGDILILTALLENFREQYPKNEWDIFVATQKEYVTILEGNRNVDAIIEYQIFMDSELACVGQGNKKGPFDGYCFPAVSTQRFLNYLYNDNLSLIS